MRRFEKFLIGALFSLLFSSFILLTTLSFQILNSSYLFPIFEKHNVYEELPKALAQALPNDPNLTEDERINYSLIFQNFSPSLARDTIEGNILQVLDFIHGKSENFVIFFPTKALGLAQDDLKWSLSQNANPILQEQIKMLQGIGGKLLILWIIVFGMLITLFFLYGRVSNTKRLLSGNILLITNGTMLLVYSLILKFLLNQIAGNLPNQSEPSQKILGLLSSSLFSEIVSTWILIGVLVATTGFIIFVVEKKRLIA